MAVMRDSERRSCVAVGGDCEQRMMPVWELLGQSERLSIWGRWREAESSDGHSGRAAARLIGGKSTRSIWLVVSLVNPRRARDEGAASVAGHGDSSMELESERDGSSWWNGAGDKEIRAGLGLGRATPTGLVSLTVVVSVIDCDLVVVCDQ
ncbi:hypothetical protein M0R45_023587 [Rubus argutus]|uniref:Uncharacterized protein n=1 Tax=Rubus argutus TaxID=59490 RepID=A0AAW1WQI9_RUBAR